MSIRIAEAEVYSLRLPFQEEFRIARGSVGDLEAGAPHIYVRLLGDNGVEGWGEARPSHRWSYETEASVLDALRNYLIPAARQLDDLWDLAGLAKAMDTEIAPGLSIGMPIAKCALDTAVHDLLARTAGVPLNAFLGGRTTKEVALTYLISVTDPAVAEEKADTAWEAGYRGFKVKIGVEPAKDLEILRAVRATCPDAFLWTDANQAYDPATAIAQCRQMEPLNVGCYEQPVPGNDWTGLRRVAQSTDIPIAADESVFSPRDLLQLIRLEALDMLVLKLSKMGGVGPATLCTRIAREAGIPLLGSGLTESRLGLAASAHVYSAFGGLAFADLNGPQFLGDDPIEGVDVRPGIVVVPDGPGIGVTVNQEKLARFRRPEPAR